MATKRIAALSDIHVHADSTPQRDLFADISSVADVLVLAGDLTDHGLPAEAIKLRDELSHCSIPVIAVLGNHDYESGKQKELKEILAERQITVLQGDHIEIADIGFAGVKGFCGGFETFQLASWGEQVMKQFVEEAVQEGLALEKALQQLSTPNKIVITHYAPIKDTIKGEPPELFAFLGCSRLEDVINRMKATCAIHGHAHHGVAKGKTATGIPVYNVALHIEKEEKKPYTVIAVEV